MTFIDHEIRPLVGIRGIATIWVVLYHAFPVLLLLLPGIAWAEHYLASSLLAVDFFFILSGFILTYRYLDRLSTGSVRQTGRYLRLRFARIWPVHAVMVGLFVAYDAWSKHHYGSGLWAENLGLPNVGANLLMLHEFPDATAINPPAWSLAPEFGAYVLFPLLAVGLVRLRSWQVAFAAAAVVVAAGAGLLWWLYLREGPQAGSLYLLSWLRIAVCFPTGCLLAVAWRELPWFLQRHANWDVAALLGFAATGFIVYAVNREGELRAPVAALPFLALTVVACAGATGPVASALGHRVVEWGGRISYSVYLTHYLVVIAVNAVLQRDHAELYPQWGKFLVLVMLLVGFVAAGALSYYAVEEPARRALRRRAR